MTFGKIGDKILDKPFSEFVRKRAILRAGGCERCGHQKHDIQKDNGDTLPAWKQLDCCHFIPRGTYSVRWDPDNAVGLCSGCHLHIDNDSKAKEAFKLQILGERGVELLEARRRNKGKVDRAAIKLWLKSEIGKFSK